MPYIHSAYTGALQNVTNPDAKIQGLDNILSAYMKSMAFAEQNGWGKLKSGAGWISLDYTKKC